MTITRKLTSDQQVYITDLTVVVNSWAKTNVPIEYTYNSKSTYWASAVKAGIITREDYDLARSHYSQLWNYVGD